MGVLIQGEGRVSRACLRRPKLTIRSCGGLAVTGSINNRRAPAVTAQFWTPMRWFVRSKVSLAPHSVHPEFPATLSMKTESAASPSVVSSAGSSTGGVDAAARPGAPMQSSSRPGVPLRRRSSHGLIPNRRASLLVEASKTTSAQVAAATQPAAWAQMAAGHPHSFVPLPGGFIAKLTDTREARCYDEFADELLGVIPKTLKRSELVNQLPLNEDEIDRWLAPLDAQLAGKADKVLLFMEDLTANIPEQHKLVLDIKMGSQTALKEELIDAGMAPDKAAAKEEKMTQTDLRRGARSEVDRQLDRAYTLAGQIENGISLNPSPEPKAMMKVRDQMGAESRERIAGTLCRLPNSTGQDILRKLRDIKQKTQTVPVTFIGSSLLICINEQDPDQWAVRLIDLGHPIRPDEGTAAARFNDVQRQFQQGLDKLIELFEKTIGSTTS